MPLSCECDWWDGEGWTYLPPECYVNFCGQRRKRCCSCHELIDIGALTAIFERICAPRSDTEALIRGDDAEIPLASWYMCERCADLYFSLDELGFCISLGEDMRELVAEYAARYPITRVS